ncbi:unnamed protein product [Clonostachys rosea]|uniref:Fungal lipase-type domain-containing protein n=1 Tax=Bionectria ochroleuca TaxID=29856 RepID=A0ABY6V097_BIOOC|nr:unnamed protein product [Clonostachys rosea]
MLSHIFAASLLASGVLASNIGQEVYARQNEDIPIKELSRYSEYAAATYCNANTPVGDPVACEANCDEVLKDAGTIITSFNTGPAPNSDIAGYVAVVPSRNEIIFAARGTYSNQNWQTNLNFALVDSLLVSGGKFHLGFYNAWVELSEDVRAAIDKAQSQYPDFRLKVIGHSLGGAIAAVAAAHLRSDGYDFDLYTYGQPRVGNDIISDYITNSFPPGQLYRVTHQADPVPRLPPWQLFGYRHISPEIWLKGNPSDPKNWPAEDIQTCTGNWNFFCNMNPFIKFDPVDHGVYFGKMSCYNNATSDAVDTMPEGISRFTDDEQTED